jgi:hypothetical protein
MAPPTTGRESPFVHALTLQCFWCRSVRPRVPWTGLQSQWVDNVLKQHDALLVPAKSVALLSTRTHDRSCLLAEYDMAVVPSLTTNPKPQYEGWSKD